MTAVSPSRERRAAERAWIEGRYAAPGVGSATRKHAVLLDGPRAVRAPQTGMDKTEYHSASRHAGTLG